MTSNFCAETLLYMAIRIRRKLTRCGSHSIHLKKKNFIAEVPLHTNVGVVIPKRNLAVLLQKFNQSERVIFQSDWLLGALRAVLTTRNGLTHVLLVADVC